ncbi:IclR family transcriptional regulator [Nocardiopsis sp. RSe5-2]|uniref:IclR family transcriptional regulator n=1 Tax=Nocardiopsis endophytica TaxID=3018445 RepID=A0ABT4U0X6_9ACTN|nr:IclR family transcriptional regulator [Nocardiopsis endophytica]MDA2810154.1 IclR family transcriptional regulator [Nocardiopsis endophytica]
MAAEAERDGRSVTGRALRLLAAFDVAHPALTLTELARRADLPLATAHRLAGELESWRALERGSDGRFRVGSRLWEMGLLAPVSSRLRQVALPYMQDLYEATRENIHLAVRDGFDTLYVEKLCGHRSVPIVSRVGGRLPLHATGVGKVLLAGAGPQVREGYLGRPLPRPTGFTVVERGRLERELRQVARRGHALTREEMTLGSVSVAVPVGPACDGEEGPDTEPAAALGIVVRSHRADPARLVPPLKAAAQAIARRLEETARDPAPGLEHELPPMPR